MEVYEYTPKVKDNKAQGRRAAPAYKKKIAYRLFGVEIIDRY